MKRKIIVFLLLVLSMSYIKDLYAISIDSANPPGHSKKKFLVEDVADTPDSILTKQFTVVPENELLVSEIRDTLMIPDIDGSQDDKLWADVSETEVLLMKRDGEKLSVAIRAAYYSDSIFFLVSWADESKNETHETLIWDKKEKEYVPGGDIEDSLALMFYFNDVNGSCMTSGETVSADYWHWRAARSKGPRYAYDGMINISGLKLPRANSYKAKSGGKVWIQSVRDSGSSPWRIHLPVKYIGERVPSYVPSKPTISSADVKAVGKHDDGVWAVEFLREMDTDHNDDIAFDPEKSYRFSIAVYDSSTKGDHFTSPIINLRFEK
jgi:hypothetical protein